MTSELGDRLREMAGHADEHDWLGAAIICVADKECVLSIPKNMGNLDDDPVRLMATFAQYISQAVTDLYVAGLKSKL